MLDKLPPQNIEAEEAVIGSLLIDGTAMEEVIDTLKSSDFHSEKCNYTYGACLALYQRNDAINQITVAQELNRQGKLETIGAAYLSYLISICPTSLHIQYYANIVLRCSLGRQLIEAGTKIASIGYSTPENIESALDEAKALIDNLRAGTSKYPELKNLRILKSHPPHYLLDVNDNEIRLTLAELQQAGRFKTKIMSELDFIPVLSKNWTAVVNRLLENAVKLETPVDTSADIENKLLVKQYLEQRGEGEEYSDIKSGSFIVVKHHNNEYLGFQCTPLIRWLKRNQVKTSRDSLWAMMYTWGGIRHQWRIGKNESNPVRLWALPLDFAKTAEYAVEEEKKQKMPAELEKELPDI